MFTQLSTRFLVILTLLFSHNALAQNHPYQTMDLIAGSVFSEIKAHTNEINQNPDYLKTIVRKYVMPYVQDKYSAALILGNYYKSATPAQKEAYFAAFETFLVQAFAQALALYNGQNYQVASESSLEGKTMESVRVLLLPLTSGQSAIRFDFQWRKNSVTGDWLMYDLIAEGIGMIATKQTEWATLLREKGIEALTKELALLAQKPVTRRSKS